MRRAFTLIELLVVIAIIAILAALPGGGVVVTDRAANRMYAIAPNGRLLVAASPLLAPNSRLRPVPDRLSS